MIITVTLNPAIDKTVYIEEFSINEVNRIKKIRKDIGGKGINVSQNLNNLNKENLCLTILGGINGEFIKRELEKQKFNFKIFKVDDEVRVNLKIVDLINNTFTDVNEPGFKISNKKINDVIDYIINIAKFDDVIVLSGSVAEGFNKDIYKKIIEAVECKTILDTSGKLLFEGIKSKPYLIKPNINELRELVGNDSINSENEIVNVSRELINRGIKIIVVSLGEKGSIYVTGNKAFRIKGKNVEVKSTVGAGDSMVAALAIAIDEEFSIEKMARFASAVSTASILTEGSQPGDIEMINELMNDESNFKFI